MTIEFNDHNFIQCIYIHPPRTGGTTLRKFFGKFLKIPSYHRTFSQLKNQVGRDFFYFCTVRHPLLRLMSIYYSSYWCQKNIENNYGRKLTIDEIALNIEEISHNAKEKDGIAPSAIAPQHEMLSDGDDRVDFIIKNEDLKGGLVSLLNKIKKDESKNFTKEDLVGVLDRTKRVDYHRTFITNDRATNAAFYPNYDSCLSHFSDKGIENLYKFYKDDFINFNYHLDQLFEE